MPYEWTQHETAPEQSGAVSYELHLHPYRSLPRKGFAWFISATAFAMALPLLAVTGRAIWWGLLPFILLTIAGIWYAIDRTYRSGRTQEILHLDRDTITLLRRDPGRADRHWQTNPYWVQPRLHPTPVENYLTLKGTEREVELGAFLTPDERRKLYEELLQALARLRSAQ